MRALFRNALILPLTLSVVPAYADDFRFGPAYPNPGPGNGNNGGWDPTPSYPGRECAVGRDGRTSVAVNQWLQPGAILPLRQILNLGPACNGLRIERVTLEAQTQRWQSWTSVELLVNNFVVDSQNVDRSLREIQLRLDRRADELGREVATLQLRASGPIFVRAVGIQLEQGNSWPSPYPGYPGGPGHGGPGHGGPGYPPPQPWPMPPPPAPTPPPTPVWAPSAGGGYYDSTGVIQGSHRLPEMRQYGGRIITGDPVPMGPALVNGVGHLCLNIPIPLCTGAHYE